MFSILSFTIVDTLQKLLDLDEGIRAKDIAWRRHAAARFLALFATLRDLESALANAFLELSHITVDHQTPIKIIIRRRLDTLLTHVDDFGEKTIQIYTRPLFLEGYKNPYIVGTGPKQPRPDLATSLFPFACPSLVLENTRASYFIEYPTKVPTKKLLPRKLSGLPGPGRPKGQQENEELIRSSLREQISIQSVDIRERADIQRALSQTPKDVEQVRDARKKLVEFIKHQFPLDEILI